MKPFISYLKSVIRAVICGLVYLTWLNSSLKPEALAVGNAAANPFSYYVTVPFSSCILLMLTMTFFHHIMTVPLNWTAAWFPKWVSRDFNSRKRWYWPAWDSWREGINAAIVCLVGICLCAGFWAIANIRFFEALADPDKLKFFLGLAVLLNTDLVTSIIASLGQSTDQLQGAKEIVIQGFTSDFHRLKILWLIIALPLYQYLRLDFQPTNVAPKSKTKAKKKTQAQVEVDPIDQELNQLSAEMGTIKMKSVRKPKTPSKP